MLKLIFVYLDHIVFNIRFLLIILSESIVLKFKIVIN